jgi:hypothetical protein
MRLWACLFTVVRLSPWRSGNVGSAEQDFGGGGGKAAPRRRRWLARRCGPSGCCRARRNVFAGLESKNSVLHCLLATDHSLSGNSSRSSLRLSITFFLFPSQSLQTSPPSAAFRACRPPKLVSLSCILTITLPTLPSRLRPRLGPTSYFPIRTRLGESGKATLLSCTESR